MGGDNQQAAKLVADSLVWDMVWPLEPSVGNDFAGLQRFKAAGYDLVSLTLAGDNQSIGEATQRVASARAALRQRADQLQFVERVQDVFDARAQGKLGIAFHFEGTRCLERRLEMIEAYYALGVRHNLLAFNQSNSVAGGCGEQQDAGLTRFGELVVDEMQRVGMLVDLSHTGYKSTMQAMERAKKPMVFTHSNIDAVCPHWRNLRDDQIQACAGTGGLVGLSGSSGYLGDETASAESMFRHLDYAVSLVGTEHVGLGQDVVFDCEALNDYVRARPEEWPGVDAPDWPGFRYAMPEQLVDLVQLMLDRGYAVDAIRKFLGENYVRICAEVWT